MIERYYNRFQPAQQYTELLFRSGDGLQSAELNELQATLRHQIKTLGDALIKDGDLISGGQMSVSAEGELHIGAARIYLGGQVFELPAARFSIPVLGRVTLGVRHHQRAITELEDPSLRDPAVGTRNYQEPGAARLHESLRWGWEAEAAGGGSDGAPGEFYPVTSIVDGVQQNRERPPAFDGVTQMVARYDYEANGHYIVHGFALRYLQRRSADGAFELQLSAGTCNVSGFKVERIHDERLVWAHDPELARVQAEPSAFAPDAQGRMRIALNHSPLHALVRVQGTRRRSQVAITHGLFSGAADTLPDSSVVQVLEVRQGATLYRAGADYTVQGNVINWAPLGAEPAPGSSYSVSYDHIAQVEPLASDEASLTVDGLVAGTLVQVDYDWMLPRIDALAIDRHGSVQRIRGLARAHNPQPPHVGPDLLRIADVALHWRAQQPLRVHASGVRTVPTAELEAMRGDIARLYELMAREHLTQDLTLREPAAKRGIFADPFLDNDLRDAGAAQNAAIIGGRLSAPLAASVLGPYLSQQQTLAHGWRSALEQLARTGEMKVNPYAATLPMPAAVTLSPDRDFWSEHQVHQAAAVSEVIDNGWQWGWWGWWGGQTQTETRRTEVLGRTETALPNLRPIAVAVRAAGFGPLERVSAMRFDGISLPVPAGAQADSSGLVQTQFTIPAGLPAGVKRFEIEGSGGSMGEASFEGRGTLIATTQRERITTTITRWWWWWDPLAQTFTLPEARQIGAVDLWFTVPGTRPVTVQLRETQVGMPTRSILAEGRILASQIAPRGQSTRIAFEAPVQLQAGVEYALVVLTDDTETACALAELGKWDTHARRWVTGQPYQIGVLLSSSNASTWSAHQGKDLAFRLLEVATTQQQRSIALASAVQVRDATDLLLLGDVALPSAPCRATVRITLAGGRVLRGAPNSTLRLDAPYSGPLDVALELEGSAHATPVVAPHWQLVVATLSERAHYISRAIPAAASFRARVFAEVFAPGQARVQASLESAQPGQFVPLELAQASDLGDGWVECEWSASALQGVGSAHSTRVRLDIDNSAAQRAAVRNLRAVMV